MNMKNYIKLTPKFLEENPQITCDHEWKDARAYLGLVGTFYPSVYKYVCMTCKTLRLHSGELQYRIFKE